MKISAVRAGALVVSLGAAASLTWLASVPACSSDPGAGVSPEENAQSDCEKNGAKCYATAGGCPGLTVPQQWSCPQSSVSINPNKCCAPKDAGSDG